MIRSRKTKNKLFRHAALTGSSLGILAVLTSAALAQEDGAAAAADATAERVVVTGSNIPSAAEVGSTPLNTVDAAAIERTGSQDVLAILQKSDPSFSGGGNIGPSNASINGGSTYNGSAISLRGLPTLVLLNGRRVTSSAALAAGGSQFADVSLFPISLIKRIEVLKDGASAIYGSDAVGGVVNVILNNDFQGAQFDGRFGFAEKGDIQDQRYSLIGGIGDAKTRIVVAGEYLEQDPIFNRQRDFAGPSFGTVTYAGVIRGPGGAGFVLNPALNSPSQTNPPGSAGTTLSPASLAPGTYRITSPVAIIGGFDLSKATNITSDMNRTSAYGSVERELFGKHMTAFADFLYSKNYGQYYFNAQPLGTNATSGGVIIPADAPYNPFAAQIDPTSARSLVIQNRFVQVPRVFRTDTNFYRFVGGLRGEIVKDYNYEVAFNGSRGEIDYKNEGVINRTALNQAVAGGYNAAGVRTPGGTFSLVNGNLQPALDFFARSVPNTALEGVVGTDFQNLLSALWSVDGKITAFPVTLPAGPLGVAVGGEYRNEKIRAEGGPQVFINAPQIGSINKSQDVRAGFAEIQIPVIGAGMNIPGVYSFDVNAAVRYEDYSTAGESIVPKVGFIYRPVQDVAIRGSYSESFVAPNLSQLFGPPGTPGATVGVTLDPAIGPEQGALQQTSNPNLEPSDATTYALGIVLSPRWVEGLTLSADYFHVDQTGVAGYPGDATILQSVNKLGPASPYASFVHLGNFDGPTVTAPGQLAGNLINYAVQKQLQNVGGTRIQGVDFTLNYTHDYGTWGVGSLGINGTYFTQYKQQQNPGDPFYDALGYYGGGNSANTFGNGGVAPDYRLVPYIEYRWGGATVSALGNYTPSMRDAVSIDLTDYQRKRDGYLPKIRDYYTIDLRFSYEFGLRKPDAPAAPVPAPKDGKDGKSVTASAPVVGQMASTRWFEGLKLGFGVNNVTNARPPLIADSPDSTNTEASYYDPYQRYYYFTVSKKF